MCFRKGRCDRLCQIMVPELDVGRVRRNSANCPYIIVIASVPDRDSITGEPDQITAFNYTAVGDLCTIVGKVIIVSDGSTGRNGIKLQRIIPVCYTRTSPQSLFKVSKIALPLPLLIGRL